MSEQDNTNIGTMLLAYGLEPSQLTRALCYQRENPGKRLGEICVRLGFISRDRLDIALHRQAALRDRKVGEFVELASARTRTMAASVASLAATNLAVLEKLK